jgi:hypothetical protein
MGGRGRGRGRGRGASPGGRGRGRGRSGGGGGPPRGARRGYHSDGDGDRFNALAGQDFISLFMKPPGSAQRTRAAQCCSGEKRVGGRRGRAAADDPDAWQSDDEDGDGNGTASAGISIGARRWRMQRTRLTISCDVRADICSLQNVCVLRQPR